MPNIRYLVKKNYVMVMITRFFDDQEERTKLFSNAIAEKMGCWLIICFKCYNSYRSSMNDEF